VVGQLFNLDVLLRVMYLGQLKKLILLNRKAKILFNILLSDIQCLFVLQLQMMPNMNQQLMQSRMGMMPIRMGIPMQLRPGFHPGMQAG